MSIKIYVIWGESPEPGTKPTEYTFATQAEVNAFWLGVTESDGWLGYQEVDGPNYVADEFGDIVNSDLHDWLRIADECMLKIYGITFNDAGFDPPDDWRSTTPEEWVDWVGEKYGLTPKLAGQLPW